MGRWAVRLALLVLAATGPAWADAPAPARNTMVLFIDADRAAERRSAAVLGAIRAGLVDLHVELQVERAGGPADVRRRMDRVASASGPSEHRLGALWLDLTQPDLLIFVANADGTRLLVRRIRVTQGSEAAAVEEAGVVVRSTVGA